MLQVGDKVQVSWSGGWYNAKVLEVGEGNYRVHYEGWGSEWDEWVIPSRMRLQDGGAVAAPPTRPQPVVQRPPPSGPEPLPEPRPAIPDNPPAPPTPKVWSTHPAGRWGCRTWDAGQVNRVGEFMLNADGTYRDLMYKGSGRYSFDKKEDRIVFTSGPQKPEARITFNAEGHQGKGHIVFHYSGGARLDCYREALP
jgi:hypothetical protein